MRRLVVLCEAQQRTSLSEQIPPSEELAVHFLEPAYPHWPKLVEGGNLDAVVVTERCLPYVTVELAAELSELEQRGRAPAIFVLAGEDGASAGLAAPPPLRRAQVVNSLAGAIGIVNAERERGNRNDC